MFRFLTRKSGTTTVIEEPLYGSKLNVSTQSENLTVIGVMTLVGVELPSYISIGATKFGIKPFESVTGSLPPK